MAHEEQNDALSKQNKIALERYYFAIKCLDDKRKRVADIACGMGYGTYLLKKAGHKVVGFDKSIEAIKYAEKTYPANYILLNVENFKAPSFDVVVCLETLCHLQEPKKFINNLLAKELIISAPIDPDPNDGYHYRFHNLSENEFKKMFDDWQTVEELRQKKYLTLHLKKI